jgi:hypothetical protein
MTSAGPFPKPDCPNCFPGNIYCPECGEKRLPREDLSLRHFLRDLFQDFTDIDSKLFRTLYLLSFRPGFLTTEFSRGVRQPYVKPFRLFIIVALIHFLTFRFFSSGDLYTLKNLQSIDIPGAFEWLRSLPGLSGVLITDIHEADFNSKLKDILSLLIYVVIFAGAGHFNLIFRMQKKYYTEHLVFILHVVTAVLLRNLVLLPLFIIHQPSGVVLAMVLHFVYIVLALKNYYRISTIRAIAVLPPTALVILILGYSIFMVSGVLALVR